MPGDLRTVCLLCGASEGAQPEYVRRARELAEMLVAAGIAIVYGGGCRGLMGAISDSAVRAGGKVRGVVPRDLFDQDRVAKGLAEMHVVDSISERKQVMFELADAIIALPGGLGTFDELTEALVLRQFGLSERPVAAFDVRGYFGPLQRLLRHAVDEGFVAPEDADRLVVDANPNALLARLRIARSAVATHRATRVEMGGSRPAGSTS